jgi:cytoplasmic iron level regulating protein YaaA (DUF328/UPF0246 family)
MPKRKGSTATPKHDAKRVVSIDNANTDCSYQLIAILSPAKTLDLSPLQNDTPCAWTEPECDPERRQQVIDAMSQHATKPAHHLRKILNVSQSLAENAQRYWMSLAAANDKEFERKPSGFAFDGVAYKGLDMPSLSKDSVMYLQEHLRIVDPLYGWLRPMDAIEPYRLEMANKGVLENVKKLADFWKPAIRDSIEKTEKASTNKILIVNLASDEYSAAVDWPDAHVVKVIFRHAGRLVAVHAKRARGLMARYMAEHKVTTIESLADFDLEGYSFQARDSVPLPYEGTDDEDGSSPQLVFDRPASGAPAPKKKQK